MKLRFIRTCLIVIIGILSFNMTHAIAKDGVIYKTASGVNFLNDGIGEEEGADIRRSAKNFSLQLLLTAGEVALGLQMPVC